MTLYDHNDTPILDLLADDKSYRYKALMGENALTLYFSLTDYIDLPLWCYVVYKGEKYSLFSPEQFKKNHTRSWDYTLRLEAASGWLSRVKFKFFTLNNNVIDGPVKLKFSLTATPAEFATLLVNNLNANDPEQGWTVGDCIDLDPIVLDFNHEYLNASLPKIANGFDTEYDIEHKTLSIGPVEKLKGSAIDLSYGYNKGVLGGIVRTQYDDSKVINRLYVQGGSQNINAQTYNNDTLLLPRSYQRVVDGVTYTTDAHGSMIQREITQGRVIEDSLDVSDIKPSRTGVITSVEVIDDAKSLYDVIDIDIPQDLDFSAQVIPGETMTIIFQTGLLAGKEFDVEYVHDDRRFRIVPITDSGVSLPKSPLVPQAGDSYSIFHIDLPASYIQQAEMDAFDKALASFLKREQPVWTYRWTLDELFAKRNWDAIGGFLDTGYFVSFHDDQFLSIAQSIRIVSVKEYVNKPKSPVIEISNQVSGQSLGTLVNKVDSQDRTIERTSAAALDFTRRRFRDAQETYLMLEQSFTNFSGSVNPLTVQTMALLVGDESLQFRFVSSKTTPVEVTDNIQYDAATKRLFAPALILQHMTIGIESISSSHTADEYRYWDIAAFMSPALDEQDKKYYLYARVSITGDTGQLIMSEQAIGMRQVEGQYHLLVGVLNSEYDSDRSLVTLYGFSEVLPGRITTSRIVSPSGNTFIDLVNEEIRGNFTFQSGAGVEDTIEEVANNVNYRVEIRSSNGTSFRNDNISTTLEARVYHGANDITDTLPGTAFRWRRVSDDPASDEVWNFTYASVYSNVIYLTSDDVDARAVFNCDVNIP